MNVALLIFLAAAVIKMHRQSVKIARLACQRPKLATKVHGHCGSTPLDSIANVFEESPMKSQFQFAAEQQSNRPVARLRQRVNSRRYLGPIKLAVVADRVLAAVTAPDAAQAAIDVQAAHAVKEWDGE